MVVDGEEETMATMEEIEQNLKEKKQKKEIGRISGFYKTTFR